VFGALTLKLSLLLSGLCHACIHFTAGMCILINSVHKFNKLTCLYEEYCYRALCQGWCICVYACVFVCMCYRENILSDCFQGCFIVTCTLCTFISLVWLREQILHGGGPDWLDQEPALVNHRQVCPASYVNDHVCSRILISH